MTRYAWPRRRTAAERDDAAGRARFLEPRRSEVDLTDALESSRRVAPQRVAAPRLARAALGATALADGAGEHVGTARPVDGDRRPGRRARPA